MACGGVPYEENLWCSICLDLFTDPVTLPCGHNFCKTCITRHWTCSQTYQCALCKERFPQNTQLRVNIVLSQMSQQMKTSIEAPAREGGRREGDGEVRCDACERTALKSCVICLTSFCDVHLAPHYRSPGLRRHQLIEPVQDLEQRTCQKHNRPLRFFCQSDQTCICQFCSESEHSGHAVVSMEQEGAHKRQELSKLQDKICQMTTERRRKMDLLGQAARGGEDKLAENKRDCVQAVCKVSRSLEQGLYKLIETMESRQREAERQTDCFVSQLEGEICELVSAKAELEENKNTDDNFKLIQNFESLQILPRTLDVSKVEVGAFQRGVVDEVVKKMGETVVDLDKFWMEIELKRVQQFTVDASLNARTLYPHLTWSEEGKRLEYSGPGVSAVSNPDMFSKHLQCMFFGNFYFEVTVGGAKTWNVGVIREKNDKKFGQILRPENGFWVIWLKDGVRYCALTKQSSVKLRPSTTPQRIGVYVDYEAGLVSFYNSGTAEKIYTFEKCQFKGRVLPYSELQKAKKIQVPIEL